MTALARFDDEPESLAQLAETANREHFLTEQSVRLAFDHAIAAGFALATARSMVQRDGWLAWLSENFRGGCTTAYRYIRAAEHKSELAAAGVTSMKDADALLAGKPDIRVRDGEFKRRSGEAIALREDGLTHKEIASVMGGTSETTVWALLHPDAYEAKNKSRKEARRKRRDEKAALQRAERDRAMRKIKGPRAEAYSLARRLAQVLDQAHAEADTRDARAALNEAIAAQHKLEDAIVRAGKLS